MAPSLLATVPAGFLWLGSRGLTLLFGKPGPSPIPLTQVSLKSQTKPNPRAEPAGVTMASLQTGLLVPQKHRPCGWGLLNILPDVESRSLGITGEGLAFRIMENTTSSKRLTPFPVTQT